MKRLLGLLSLCALIVVPMHADAALYGRGNYSDCEYSRDCPSPTSLPIPAEPQTPTADNTDIVVTIANLAPGAVINADKVDVIVKIEELLNDGTSEPISPDKVGWVVLYVNDKQAAVQYNPSGNGIYKLPWDLTKNPGTRLAIVVYDRSGVFLKRKDLVVAIAKRFLQGQQPGGVTGSSASDERITLSPPLIIAAKSFPYWIFLILLIVALRIWWQSIREIRASDRLRKLVAQERSIAQLKEDFMNLISHYLRTATTTIGGGIELLPGGDVITSGPLQTLKQSSDALRTTVEDLIHQAQVTSGRASVIVAAPPSLPARPYRTLAFWIPLFSVALLCACADILLERFTNVLFAPAELLAQTFTGLAVVIFLLLAVRQSQIKKAERAEVDTLLQRERELDQSRNEFIERAAATLEKPLSMLTAAVQPFANQQNSHFLTEGLKRLRRVVAQFRVASLARSKRLTSTLGANIPLVALMKRAAEQRKNIAEQKQLAIHWPANETRFLGDARLVGFVLEAVIDNAIKFSNEHGAITIAVTEAEENITITVQDNGIGISESKQSLLFQPFSRGSGTETFDYEGMGFSLFLCKLILAAIGGSIELASAEQEGTTVTITLPTNQNAQAASSK